MADKWFQIRDLKDIDQLPTTDGVEFDLFVSPYDVPEAVGGGWDEDRDRFVIEFRYLDVEPTRTKRVDEFVQFRVGRYSKRIYAIEVDVKSLGADAVALRMNVIEHVENAFKSERGKNLRATGLAKSAFESRRDEVLQSVSG